ncbi:MAG: M3 family oligoendopeptidase [Erysipelotrichia bacterium]|nr:M3 family oligoendopeptidase [Erysipelotrichia bacterium]
MKFSDMEYKRPDMGAIIKEMSGMLDELQVSPDAASFITVFKRINEVRSHLQTASVLTEIRHTINTADEFYTREKEFWDETLPKWQVYEDRFKSICMDAPYRDDLRNYIPDTFFMIAECERKSFSDSIIDLMITENKLSTAYGKLKASAKIEFNGEELNLSGIAKYTEDTDPEIRRSAYNAKMKFFAEHESEFDDIFDQMVQVRDQMAHKLGFNNYVELAYCRMNRLDYNAEMISSYRKQILDEVTPEVTLIHERQRKRLGKKHLAYYDLPIEFADGNAVPIGTAEELVQNAVQMYHEMSPETKGFIDTMQDNHLWDLVSRPNKEMGGYMTQIEDYKVPFIFSNFNGTSSDVDVLTHEAGHSFQYYLAKDIEIPDMALPTMESCEIDSMSMEFFAEPWMELFFGNRADRYRYSHLAGTLSFLPYGCLVDHFQQEVYENPAWSKEERKQCWRRLEKMYQPDKDYEGCNILERGCWWYQQNHIFQSPFYYIDYTLAQVCAQQFAVRIYDADPTAWSDYIHLLKLGGTLTFTDLVKEAGLKNPFEKGTIASIVASLEKRLSSIDDSQL